ncbi:hypothetical protein [Pontibacter amylolyticus]|uniref:Uncharacterized protein n=1 Tax=Pontibacter amylolyticus TaxID=1424080 RepID=A0ABQ1VW96_9BACT|nr:hypothetical protein [Pontibacter amylolyticus]GGG02540.1 hypothetical protein GCM10011323_04200 [Pontibacter amylolyticus]
MRKLTLYLAAPLALMLTAFSCDKNDDLEVMEATATLLWTGDYAVDGCGFSVYLNDQHYKTDNEQEIDNKFKTQDAHTVLIKYTLPAKPKEYSCGWGTLKKSEIRLLSIKEV